jgi:hypothetical protein
LSQANGYFERDGLNELGMTWDARIARYLDSPLTGENVAWGQGSYDSPAGIVSQWMHSPTPRDHPQRRSAPLRPRPRTRQLQRVREECAARPEPALPSRSVCMG